MAKKPQNGERGPPNNSSNEPVWAEIVDESPADCYGIEFKDAATIATVPENEWLLSAIRTAAKAAGMPAPTPHEPRLYAMAPGNSWPLTIIQGHREVTFSRGTIGTPPKPN